MATSTKTGQSASSPQVTAIRMLAQQNLHQHIWLPHTDTHERLRVTFSTTSNFQDETLPAFLFVGPMFGSRYMMLLFDKLAKDTGIRGIAVDRPAFGGSTPVPFDIRLDVWLETVPALLQHLKVKHVSLFTHSAGTVYTLNTLVRLPHILDPKSPFVAFIGPWVHSEHSKVALMALVNKVPPSLFSAWSSITTFVNQKVVPATSWSGGVISSIGGFFSGSEAKSDEEDESEVQAKYGLDKATAKELESLYFKYLLAEGMKGGNDEALLCSKARGSTSWGACDDYMTCIKTIAESEKERLGKDPSAAKLRVRLHFAQDDMMIGKGGKKYFEECWQQEGVSDAVDVKSKEWPDTNHETVSVEVNKGAMRGIFEDIKNGS